MDEGDSGQQRPEKTAKRVMAVGVAVALIAATIGVAFFLTRPTGTTPEPQPVVPDAPRNMRGTAGDGTVAVSWDAPEGAVSFNLYAAEQPGVSAGNYASLPGGARYENVVSPYSLGLANDRTYYFRATAVNAVGESAESAELSLRPQATIVTPPLPVYVTGVVEFESGEPATGADVLVRAEDYSAAATAVIGEDGRFNVGLSPTLPGRVLVKVTHSEAGLPPVTGFRWSLEQPGAGAVDVGRVLLPEPSGKALAVAGPTATSADGSIRIAGVPAAMASVHAQSYVAADQPDLFPGELAEGRSQPINNVVFLWITGLDAAGNHVTEVNPPAQVRLRVPESQWMDLEDLQPGNGVIDTPIYSMDYESGYWVREPDGVLVDEAGARLPESAEAAIRTGAHAGDVFAEFAASHFSWWNVDKPPKVCGGEYGDAPDPTYPTLASSGGAYHRDMCRAWLGEWVDADFAAQVTDKDYYDDSLRAVKPVKVRVSNWNWPSNLFLNILADRNADGDWADSGERVLENLRISVPAMRSKVIETTAVLDVESWVRITLTGEAIANYDGHGTFDIGETEDIYFKPEHPVSVSVSGNGRVVSTPAGIDCGGGSYTCYAKFATGTVVTLTAIPDANESFQYWGYDCTGSNPVCTLVMGANKLAYHTYAVFSRPAPPRTDAWLTTYVYGNGTVHIQPPGRDCRSQYGCSNLYPKDTTVILTATPDPGESFLGWSGACSGTNTSCTVVMTRDLYATARFSQAFFPLQVYVTGNGSVQSSPSGIDCKPLVYTGCTAWFAAGTVVTLTATPDAGDNFLGWDADCKPSGTSPVCSLTMTAARRAGAGFSQSTLALTVYLVGNGTVTSSPSGIDCRPGSNGVGCTAWFTVRTNVTLTATPEAGESFLGWGARCDFAGLNATCTVTIGEVPWTTYAIAEFTQPYYLLSVYLNGNGTVTSVPAGIDCRPGRQDPGNGTGGGLGCSAAFRRGMNVTLTAAPDANESFLDWGGACEYAGNNTTCVVRMDTNLWAYAQFTSAPSLYVYAASNNTGRGNVTSAPPGVLCHIGSYLPNASACYVQFPRFTTVVLTATPDPGYTFVEWTGDCTGTSPTCTLFMDANKVVRARFA
jgi:uncharacterized repeat protein (TIGR02543 family)